MRRMFAIAGSAAMASLGCAGAGAQVQVQSRGVEIVRAGEAAPEPVTQPATAVKPVTGTVVAPLPTPAKIVAQPVVAPVPAPAPAPGRPSAPVVAAPAVAAPMIPAARSCSRPFASPAVTLTPSGFDRKLAGVLKRKPASAVIDLPQPFAVSDAPPPSLDPWLSQLKASGGFTTVNEYCQQSRGFFKFLRGIFGTKQATYTAVDGYDAIFHVDGTTQVVTQVELKRRAS